MSNARRRLEYRSWAHRYCVSRGSTSVASAAAVTGSNEPQSRPSQYPSPHAQSNAAAGMLDMHENNARLSCHSISTRRGKLTRHTVRQIP